MSEKKNNHRLPSMPGIQDNLKASGNTEAQKEGQKTTTPSSETQTASTISDIETIVDQMVESEMEKLRLLALSPDTAVVARLTMAMLKPFYLWLLTELKAASPPEKMLGAMGQVFGNFTYLTATRAVIPAQQQQALKAIMDTAMAKIGNRTKKSAIILPGQM